MRKGRALARRAAAQPGPTAWTVKQRALRQARVQVARLPPPAQQAARRGRAAYRRATTAPVPTAKAVVQRLPEPAQRLAHRAWEASGRIRRPAGRYASDPAPKPSPTPKGPAPRLWKDAYRRIVGTAWSEPAPWLVVAPGSPADVRDARSPRATTFPDTRGGQPFADDLSHIAHLEAQRYAGHRHLVLPEGSRPWFRQQGELRDHVVRTYRTIADEPDAGAVFDLSRPAEPGPRSLRAAIEDLTAGLGHAPAVLDCTELDLRAELPDLAVFSPPDGNGLPYLDGSVDVVVVGPADDIADARRAAGLGVITVATGQHRRHRSVGRRFPCCGRACRARVGVVEPRSRPALGARARRAGRPGRRRPAARDHRLRGPRWAR